MTRPTALPAGLLSTLGACALLAAACAPPPPATTPDAGPAPVTPDAGPSAPPVVSPCDEDQLEIVTSTQAAVELDLDTSSVKSEPRDLGLECGNVKAEEWAPQRVVRYTVPGTGPKTLAISTKNEGTPEDVVTVVQVRRSCERVPSPGLPPSCFNPSDAALQAEGVTAATGGETLYIVVTGYADLPAELRTSGPVRLTIAVADEQRPTLSAATAAFVGEAVEVGGTIADADRNIGGLAAVFLDAQGAVIDLDANGAIDGGDEISRAFAVNLNGLNSYTGSISVSPASTFLRQKGAVKARVRAFDDGFQLSDPIEVAIAEIGQVGVDGTCTPTARCYPGLDCRATVCTAPADAIAACDNATPINLAAPQGETTAKVVLGSVGAGSGVVSASCADTGGREAVYAVAVPEGKFDLIAQTNVDGTAAGLDTVVYVRKTCADPSSEKACSDDVASRDPRSAGVVLDAAPGTWFVFVEQWQGVQSGSARFNLRVSLRPVLATGAACDTEQVKNRCERGRCTPSTALCP